MQGFNRYIPPDYDPKKHHTLNDYQGKKALGDRERKRDQGILIVRFELPFNIWCGTCNAHIGMGVRYNAEKKKIGNYYSTPIYSFRCKCHLCSGWFEIQTDPKNTRYVVVSGARQKDEDWDPEENGGFAIHETDPNKPPEDPFASVEKTTAAQHHTETVQKPRIAALQELSEHYNSDPYALSITVRKKFREEKKVEKRQQEADDNFKDKYSLPADLNLVSADEVREEARDTWAKRKKEFEVEEAARKRRLQDRVRIGDSSVPKLPSRTTSSSQKQKLATTILMNSLSRSDPFATSSGTKPNKSLNLGIVPRR
ncbi:hypothetical protein FRC03_006690 [Tulasnella sp. 419]|nr:hypothetical protein FRC03_006690 [Tulasnella sp. 419]